MSNSLEKGYVPHSGTVEGSHSRGSGLGFNIGLFLEYVPATSLHDSSLPRSHVPSAHLGSPSLTATGCQPQPCRPSHRSKHGPRVRYVFTSPPRFLVHLPSMAARARALSLSPCLCPPSMLCIYFASLWLQPSRTNGVRFHILWLPNMLGSVQRCRQAAN